jgi:cytosine/uracil/thiamine/allantoin permease
MNRGNHADVLFDRRHTNWAGFWAMAVGMGVSIGLFANQPPRFTAWVPTHHPAVGDLTFEVGFVIAAVLYYLLYKAGLGPKRKAATGSS